MRRLLCSVFLAGALFVNDNGVTQSEGQQGWLSLFDGTSLFGWTAERGASWTAKEGMLSTSNSSGYLRTNSPFSDFTLKLEFREQSHVGGCYVLLRAAASGDPSESAYQLELAGKDSTWPTGSISGQFKAKPVAANLNQWHSLEATLLGDQIEVSIDGQAVVNSKDSRASAGYVGLQCPASVGAQFRNIRLRPLAMKPLFNGSDLSGWKVVGPPPPKKGGLLHFGGKVKPAQWSVNSAMVHGGGGVGQLETAATYDDFVLQLAVRINQADKRQLLPSVVSLRGDPGQLFSGYDIQVSAASGGVALSSSSSNGGGGVIKQNLMPKGAITPDKFATETIVARGRHIQVWLNGTVVTDYQDTRADDNSARKGARITAGTIGFALNDEKLSEDLRSIQIVSLPSALGKGQAAPQPAATVPAPVAPPASGSTIPAPPPAQVIQIPGPAADPNKPKVQKLMAEALATNDPQQQLNLYNQMLVLDPDNPAAATGRQQAQQKIDEAAAKLASQQASQQQAEQTEQASHAQGDVARQAAEAAFVADDMKTAKAQLAIAEKVYPGDPMLQELQSRVDQRLATHDRLQYLLAGAGVLAILALAVLLIKKRGKKQAYLEVVEGLDKGRRFDLDKEIIHIGAVAQDGGNKNEIVVQDVERMISRFHCEIHKRNGKFYLIDCGSANGTSVDRQAAKAAQPVLLKNGARVDLAGTCTLRLGFEKKA